MAGIKFGIILKTTNIIVSRRNSYKKKNKHSLAGKTTGHLKMEQSPHPKRHVYQI
jgi:hypothetical protein